MARRSEGGSDGIVGYARRDYVRVSTEEQVDGTSLGVQRESCRRVVEQRDCELVGAFSDEVSPRQPARA